MRLFAALGFFAVFFLAQSQDAPAAEAQSGQAEPTAAVVIDAEEVEEVEEAPKRRGRKERRGRRERDTDEDDTEETETETDSDL